MLALAIGATLTTVGLLSASDRQVFRGATDAVVVDVAVLDGNQALSGLTKADFAVTDNGVPQVVRDASLEQEPLDVTLAIDVSGSILPPQLEELVAAVRQIGAVLRPDDRCRVMAFAAHVAERSPLATWPVPIDLSDRDRLGGSTALLDATALALMSPAAAGRRRLVIALTDGIENSSTIGVAGLSDSVKYSEAVLHFILASRQDMANTQYRNVLATASAASGGRTVQLNGRSGIGDALRASIEEMHTSYTVRYVLEGVPVKGWHDITVKLTRPGKFIVRARKGYFVG